MFYRVGELFLEKRFQVVSITKEPVGTDSISSGGIDSNNTDSLIGCEKMEGPALDKRGQWRHKGLKHGLSPKIESIVAIMVSRYGHERGPGVTQWREMVKSISKFLGKGSGGKISGTEEVSGLLLELLLKLGNQDGGKGQVKSFSAIECQIQQSKQALSTPIRQSIGKPGEVEITNVEKMVHELSSERACSGSKKSAGER